MILLSERGKCIGDFVTLALFVTYVDDFLIAGPVWLRDAVVEQIRYLWSCSEPVVLLPDGELKFCGIWLERAGDRKKDLKVHQTPYTTELLRKRGHSVSDAGAGHEYITLPAPKASDKPPSAPVLKELQGVTGELNWLAVKSRPDISYVCSVLASAITRLADFSHDLQNKIFRYLKRHPACGILFRHDGRMDEFKISADAGYCGELDLKSQTGFLVFWCGALIMWRSARQSMVASSMTEAELNAASSA